MSTPTPSIKIKEPPNFDGDRSKMTFWLQANELYFDFNQGSFTEDKKKVIFAVILMREGPAKDWASGFIQEKTNAGDWGTWSNFKEKVKKRLL